MPSRIVHGGTIYLQNGSINVLATLSDVYDIYDTQIDKTNLSLIQHQKLTVYQKTRIHRV